MINLNEFIYEQHLDKKDYILKYITPEEIYKKYSPVKLTIGTVVPSPFRKDNNPSFSLFYSKEGSLLFKDWGTNESGDCFSFVQKTYKGYNFQQILDIIEEDFALKTTPNLKPIVYNNKPTENKVIEIKSRLWETYDLNFWQEFGIIQETLDKFNVKPLEYVFINGKVCNVDRHTYAYCEYKDDKWTYKIYQPFNTYYKWLSNHHKGVHQGYRQLPHKGDTLVITKSLKDVMALYDVLGVYSIGIQTETIVIKDSVIEEYQNRFNKVYTLFDNDETGIKLAKEYIEIYNIPSLFIPEYTYQKDFSDLVKSVGREQSKKIFNKLML